MPDLTKQPKLCELTDEEIESGKWLMHYFKAFGYDFFFRKRRFVDFGISDEQLYEFSFQLDGHYCQCRTHEKFSPEKMLETLLRYMKTLNKQALTKQSHPQ